MLNRCFFLAIILLLGTQCSRHTLPISVPAKSNQRTTQHQSIASYSKIDVSGRINVRLHTGYRHPELTITGDKRDLAALTKKVSNNTLYVATGAGYPRFGDIFIDIKGPTLNSFHYKGQGVIKGEHLHTHGMRLFIDNQGTTSLQGDLGVSDLELAGEGAVMLNGINSHALPVHIKGHTKVNLVGFSSLCELDIAGSSWISLYWVKSYNLTIRATDTAKIQLAGIVNRLDVELWGAAQFKGRYLRAQRSFVKTHDRSVAEISAVYHQSTLATDASDIYYYNISTTRADFMAYQGSVLKLREWSPFDTQDFTRYNKQFP